MSKYGTSLRRYGTVGHHTHVEASFSLNNIFIFSIQPEFIIIYENRFTYVLSTFIDCHKLHARLDWKWHFHQTPPTTYYKSHFSCWLLDYRSTAFNFTFVNQILIRYWEKLCNMYVIDIWSYEITFSFFLILKKYSHIPSSRAARG